MRGISRGLRAGPWLGFCAALSACGEATPPPPIVAPTPTASAVASVTASAAPAETCALRGVVTSDRGVKVAGAVVALIPGGAPDPAAVVRSDAQGRYCVPPLEVGTYGITATSADHTAKYIDVSDTPPLGPGAVLDIPMGGPGHVISGLVRDTRGANVQGARVFVSRFSDFMADLFVTETDSEGRYRVKLPEAGYRLQVRSETRLGQGTGVTLSKDETQDITATVLNPVKTPAPDEVVAWIKAKAIPLATPEAGRGLDDMAPLAGVVGDAHLVALGEATHGTREFFQLKHRMLEYLVEKKGFRSFGIEASFGDCMPLHEYVRTGKGDPAQALANQGFWTWDTEEVLALVKWMRAYNEDKAHKEKLSFWGFDMQSPNASTLALLAYFGKVDPAFAKEIGPALEPVDEEFTQYHLDLVPQAEIAAATETAKKILARLDAEKERYAKKTSAEAVAIARIHAQIVIDFLVSSAGARGEVRDRSMADVAAALLDLENLSAKGERPAGPGPARMMLWAHNGHVNKQNNGGPPSMGYHLAKRLGKEYMVFGFAFDEGSFQAVDFGKDERGLVPFTVGPEQPGSLDRTLGRAGVPLFALDLRGAPAGVVTDWLHAASLSRSIGALFDERVADYGADWLVPTEQFDALLFVQKTTSARPNWLAVPTLRQLRKPEISPNIPDPGFESTKTGGMPAGWTTRGSPGQLEFQAIVTDKKCASGKHCLALSRTKGDVPTGSGTARLNVDAQSYKGLRIRISGNLRMEGKGPGDEAFLVGWSGEDKGAWARVPGSDWKKLAIEITVPESAPRVAIELTTTGVAKAWLDDLEIAPLPKP